MRVNYLLALSFEKYKNKIVKQSKSCADADKLFASFKFLKA
jgi:hypothetical protein